MKVKLIRRSFIDNPGWKIMGEDIPLGTIYEVIGYARNLRLLNEKTGEIRDVECWNLRKVDDGTEGYLPTEPFKIVTDHD